jgi:putative phosphoribosyl transferase
MYFKSRADAGRQLAQKLKKHQSEQVAIVALSPGAAIIGAQIAMELHSMLALLVTENIYLPGEIEAIATMSSAGTFTYNTMFSPGQLEELASEYHQYIDQTRMEAFHKLNVLVSHDGEINPRSLRHHSIILVSDGLLSGLSLDVAQDFLKPIAINKLIIATPFASVQSVDKMHLVGDEIACLSVMESYVNTNHYYDDNTIPPVEDLFKMMKNIALSWRH